MVDVQICSAQNDEDPSRGGQAGMRIETRMGGMRMGGTRMGGTRIGTTMGGTKMGTRMGEMKIGTRMGEMKIGTTMGGTTMGMKIGTRMGETKMGEGSEVELALGHEKLRVYQRGLDYASWTHSALADIEQSAAVLDHWDRAAESIVENLANGNSRHAAADRNRYFDVAFGSALECAACLDICVCKKLITVERQAEGKAALQQIVKMTIGLRKSRSSYVKEEREEYITRQNDEIYFAHEGLDVYKVALKLIVWLDGFLDVIDLGASYATRLDKWTTSLVLNIAEGNGRFSEADQIRFLDIAHTSAMRVAACLDLLVVRRRIKIQQIEDGKQILARVVPLLLGLRGYLDKQTDEG